MKKLFFAPVLVGAVVLLFSCVSLPDIQLHDPEGVDVEVLISPLGSEYRDATLGIFDFTCGTNRNALGMRLAEVAERFIIKRGLFRRTERLHAYADTGLDQAFTLARSRQYKLVLIGQVVKYEQGSSRSEVEMQVDILEVSTGDTLWRILGRFGSQDVLRRAGPNAGKLAEQLLPEMLVVLSRVPEPVEEEGPVLELNQEQSVDPDSEYYCDGDDEEDLQEED